MREPKIDEVYLDLAVEAHGGTKRHVNKIRQLLPKTPAAQTAACQIMQILRDTGCTIRQARSALLFVNATLEYQPVTSPNILLRERPVKERRP